MPERLGHVGLAHPHRAEEEHRLVPLQEAQGGEITDDGHRDFRVVGEVEALERRLLLEAGPAQAFGERPVFPPGNLILQEHLQELQVAKLPGPGLGVRILGEVTKPKLDLLRDCDEILLEEIVAAGLYRKTSQVFAVLLPVQSVGVMGDGRTYESVVAIRAVETQDFMTADWARIPFNILAAISNRIINEVRGVNRVVYDISSKPPATIEWE